MIMLDTNDGSFKIEVEGVNEFTLFPNAIGGAEYAVMDRDQLTELRAIIDQALNTSTEELEASGE